MVYLAKKDGGVVHHTSLRALKEMDGIDKPDMTVTTEAFEAADGLVRIIDGNIFLGKTEKEEAIEASAKRIMEIDAELEEIDLRSVRPARAVSFAIGKGKAVPAEDVAKLDIFETQAISLRKERASEYEKIGVAG